MTAPDTNSAVSDNSVFQGTEDGVTSPANDHALVQIIEHAYETAGTTTRRDLKLQTQWSSADLRQALDHLEARGYAESIGDAHRQMVILTSRGEGLAREHR
jgi:DNA-binding MarR family transcriptional regulator